MKKVLKFVKGGNKKETDPSATGTRGSKESVVQLPTSSSNDSLNNNGYHVDIYGADKNMNKLHKSAYQGNMDKLKLALKVTDIDTVDELCRTALHFAITQRHTNIVWYLLNNKARMDIMDKDGFTPFHKAVQCGNTDCTHLMLERGADIDSTDDDGNTALHLATRQGYFNIAALLLKKGADLSMFNNQGEVPLHIATLGEHKDLVSLLLKYGAAVNVPDRLQRTPLMLAARVGNIQLIHVFLQHGSHLDCCDSNGWTASDYALIGGHQEIAKQLAQIPRPKASLSSEKLDMLDTIGEDSEQSDVDTSLEPNINNNNEVELTSVVNKRDISVHDSPLSCVTPPPLKPPRSWDLIQSGMIDTQNSSLNNTVQKRKSLTTLGSLESRRESFIENSNTTATTPLEDTTPNHDATSVNDQGVTNIVNNNFETPGKLDKSKTSHCVSSEVTEGIPEKQVELTRSSANDTKRIESNGNNVDSTEIIENDAQPIKCDGDIKSKDDEIVENSENSINEDDTESSSNSSSLLNELANNILVSQINRIVVDEKISESLADEDIDKVDYETESSCTSARSMDTVLSKTNEESNTSEPKETVQEIEIAKNVVKLGRAFFENKSNEESSNKNNITIKAKSTNEQKLINVHTSGESHGEDEELTLQGSSLNDFNGERDEEIQAMIMQRNLREHQEFFVEKMDGANKGKDSIDMEDSACDTVVEQRRPIETRDSLETSDSSISRSPNETDDDSSLLNNIKQTSLEKDTSSDTHHKAAHTDDIPSAQHCDSSSSNHLIDSINTDNPHVTDIKAVKHYLTSTSSGPNILSSKQTDSNSICNSCVGPNVKSCDLMTKSCDYLINNIDQVLQHINSNTSDIVQQNELLETHLCNESILNMKHLEKSNSEREQSNENVEVSLSGIQHPNSDLDLNDARESIETRLGNLDNIKNNEENEGLMSENEQVNTEQEELSEEMSDEDETLGSLQDETLLQSVMKHLPRHKSVDLSDDSMPYIASPKVKDVPGPSVHLFDELPPPPSDFTSSFVDDQPSSASLVSLDNLPLPPDDMLEEGEAGEGSYGGAGGEKQLACIEEEESVSEMSNREIPYKNMDDYSLDEEDCDGDGNRTPTNEDPTPLESRELAFTLQQTEDFKFNSDIIESQENNYVLVSERENKEVVDDENQHIARSESCDPSERKTHRCQPLADTEYHLHTLLDENHLVVEVDMNPGESHPHCSEFHSYRDYAFSLREQNDGSHIKDQLACYDRAIEELSKNPQLNHSCAKNGGSSIQNGGASQRSSRVYGESEIHNLIDQDLKCLSDKLLSEKHHNYSELYSADGECSARSSVPHQLERLLSSEDRKRKLLVSMTNIDLADEEDKEEEEGDADPPFWTSGEGGRGGRFSCVRQDTVIYNQDRSGECSPQNEADFYPVEDTMSTASSSEPSENHMNATPKHLNPMKSTSSILRETTLERGRLEEAVGVLRSRVEVLEYQLADATQSLALKSDTVNALEETVAKHEATIAHHLTLVNTLSYQNQNYESEINHLTSLYTKDESIDRIAQLESSTQSLKKKIDYLNAQINSLAEENIVLHEFIANIDSEESRNLNVPASFKLMKKQNLDQSCSNVNQTHNIPKEIYDDILNLKLNLEKEVALRKKLEEEYSIELGKKLQEMEHHHAEELKKQEQMLKKEKILKIDAELRHKKELDLERQILLHEISRLKADLKTKELHIAKLETQLRARDSEKSAVRKQLIQSVNREIGNE